MQMVYGIMETTPLTPSSSSNGLQQAYGYGINSENIHRQIHHSNGHLDTDSSITHTNGHAITHNGNHKSPETGQDKDKVEDGTETKMSFSKLPKRSKYVLVLCGFAQMCSALAFAVIAPFYPHEAEKKGISNTLIGLVFSVFELVNFTTAPIIGNYMSRVGTKFVFVSGIFVAGVSSILFGTLDKCPEGMTFFAMSMLCRASIAFGFCAFTVANFAIAANEFPQHFATVFGVLETTQGIGLMTGPLFGSLLYQLGGFPAPFYCLGVMVLLSDVLIYFLLPEAKEKAQTSSVRMSVIARIPLVVVSMANICLISMGISFVESTFAKFLEEEFDMSVGVIGAFFVISPGIYGFTMPVLGYLCDRKDIATHLNLLGLLFAVVGYLLLGPCPWPQLLPSAIWTMVVSLLLSGVSYAMVLLASTKCIVMAALEKGYSYNLEIFSLVSGLFYFSYCLGAFIGPFVGGFLTQHLGYDVAYTLLAFALVPNLIASTVFFAVRHKRRKHGNLTMDSDDNHGGSGSGSNSCCGSGSSGIGSGSYGGDTVEVGFNEVFGTGP